MDNTYFERERPENVSFHQKIQVNQLGYKTYGEKRAVIAKPCDSFIICDKSGKTVNSGKAIHFGYDRASGDDVYIMDFSDFCGNGEYRIEASGEVSVYFEISDNVFESALDKTLKALYYLRCGTELEKTHAGEYIHPACHKAEAVAWSDNTVVKDVSGGWHDAGDYGRYVTAGAVAAAHLLYSYLMFPDGFDRQNINIPESGNGVPDILSECRYELDWLLKMQREDGGVWHKCTTERHAPFVMPQDDTAQLYLFDVSSMATADFAAVCALASRVYRKFDESYCDVLLKAAVKSYDWLIENPRFAGFKNPDTCNTGEYGEYGDTDNRMWAAAELYAATGDSAYYDDAKKYADSADANMVFYELGYACVSGLASLCCLTCGLPTDFDLDRKMKESFVLRAKELRSASDMCGYGVAMEERQYCWGGNMNVLKNAMIFIIADYLEGSHRYRRYITRQLDYLFGLNATGYSYITDCGENAYNYPHLRPAHADGIEKCMPGFVSGGANRNPCDTDAEILIPKGTPPMKCFADDVGCYSLNEVTIYWNSPAVFVLGFVSQDTEE